MRKSPFISVLTGFLFSSSIGQVVQFPLQGRAAESLSSLHMDKRLTVPAAFWTIIQCQMASDPGCIGIPDHSTDVSDWKTAGID